MELRSLVSGESLYLLNDVSGLVSQLLLQLDLGLSVLCECQCPSGRGKDRQAAIVGGEKELAPCA